jgi:hypothetical protein
VSQCRESLPSLAKELACEAANLWDDKVSTQVGFIREEGKAALRGRQGARKTGSSLSFMGGACFYLVLFVGEGVRSQGWSGLLTYLCINTLCRGGEERGGAGVRGGVVS